MEECNDIVPGELPPSLPPIRDIEHPIDLPLPNKTIDGTFSIKKVKFDNSDAHGGQVHEELTKFLVSSNCMSDSMNPCSILTSLVPMRDGKIRGRIFSKEGECDAYASMKRTLNSYLKSKHVNQENGYEDDYYEGSNLSLQDPRKSYMGGQNRERDNGEDTSYDMKNVDFDDLFDDMGQGDKEGMDQEVNSFEERPITLTHIPIRFGLEERPMEHNPCKDRLEPKKKTLGVGDGKSCHAPNIKPRAASTSPSSSWRPPGVARVSWRWRVDDFSGRFPKGPKMAQF